jgi:ribosomal protein S27AE
MEKLSTKMNCPGCGSAMNHHGDKLVYVDSGEETKSTESRLGEVLEEFHACSRCGAVASRRSAEILG